MSANTQRKANLHDACEPFANEEPVSGIRKIPDLLEQPANDHLVDTDQHDVNDALVLAAFRLAVAKTDADVGLLHRRTDAFLYTTAVHQLDPGMHLYVGLSFWDPAVQTVMCNRTVAGSAADGEQASAVARRLRDGPAPGFILAIPVVIEGCIEAIIELGRSHSPFHEGVLQSTVKSVEAIVA